MSANTPDARATPERRAMLDAMQRTNADPVLSELAALRADVAELKQHLMAPQTPLIIGAEAVAAFRRLQKGGAS